MQNMSTLQCTVLDILRPLGGHNRGSHVVDEAQQARVGKVHRQSTREWYAGTYAIISSKLIAENVHKNNLKQKISKLSRLINTRD